MFSASGFFLFGRMPGARCVLRWLLACGAVLLFPVSGAAQQTRITEEATLINWWYSATYGTGFYKIGPAVATVLRFPVSYRLREMEDGKSGINLIAPVTVAMYHLNFNDFDQIDIREDVAAASVLPGIELDVPMTDAWRLRPFAQVGVGTEFGDIPRTAYIYTAGLKSLYRFPGQDWRWSVGNALFAAGYRLRDGSEAQRIGSFQIGLNLETPWHVNVWDRGVHFNSHVIARGYFSDLAFANPTPGELVVRREYEVGFSLTTPQEVSILGFGADTIGLGLRFANNVRGISLVTEFPF